MSRSTEYLGIFWLTLVIAAGGAAVADNTTIPQQPIPRVETSSHTDFIKKLAVAPRGGLALTVSDDRTGRIWSLETGRLLKILRVPIDQESLGQLYAGALSPDGMVAAVGGFTPSPETSEAIVYFFDTASGRMVMHLAGLQPAAIENLVFSMDGRMLAVAQAAGAGVTLFDWQERVVIRSDTEPADAILGAAFAPNGDFAMTTVDGKIWMYRAASRYADRQVAVTDPDERPMHLQFSPDGSEFVVGCDGRAEFLIYDSRTLAQVHRGSLPDSAGHAGLHVVEWSTNGQSIYAGGEMRDRLRAPIYRFPDRGRGSPQKLLESRRRISDIRRLPDGAFAFTSGEPEVGVVESSGQVRWRVSAAIIDPRVSPDTFRVSHDGAEAQFAKGTAVGTSMTVSVLAPPELVLNTRPPQPSWANSPDSRSNNWQVTVGNSGETLQIGGRAIVLDPHETVRSYAETPDGRRLMVGTAWSLRAYGIDNTELWRTFMSSDVGIVAVSGDSRWVVAGLSDGTIRWYRTEDGVEVLAVFVHRNGKDWIAWIPSGYYMSSIEGDNYMGWHVNRGIDREPDFYRASQFDRILYRPDIVREYFLKAGHTPVPQLTQDRHAFDIARLNDIAPPSLQISVEKVARNKGGVFATLKMVGKALVAPMQEMSLYVNGIPITPASRRQLTDAESTAFSREITVRLPQRSNTIRLESFNGQALGVEELNLDGDTVGAKSKGDLYVIAIGAQNFDDPEIPDLNYTDRDAIEFASGIAEAGAGTYREVKTMLLTDSSPVKATRSNLQNIGQFLAQATGDDAVILFLSSHGLSDGQGNYYFVATDTTRSDLDAVLDGGKPQESLVSWQFFFDTLRQTAGRRLLIVDTCSSGDMRGTFDVHSLAKRSMSSHFALITASRGDEESQELDTKGHGLFTYGLIEAIRRGFDPNGDQVLTLREAFEAANDRVQLLHSKEIGPQTPQFIAPDTLADMPLVQLARPRERAEGSTARGNGRVRNILGSANLRNSTP